MTIGNRILKLGSAFRGLWISRTLHKDGATIEKGWAVTFIKNGDYCETPYFSEPEGALDFALKNADE